MKVFITGGLGFVGRHLTAYLLEQGCDVTCTGTRPHPPAPAHDRFHYICTDTTREGAWQSTAAGCDVVYNLAGRNIFRPWTKAYKEALRASRLHTTRHLVSAMSTVTAPVLISASAVGFYGDRGDDVLDETAPGCTDFLGILSMDWENAAIAAEEKGVRVAIARFGIILGTGGGALAKMLPAFRCFLGGSLGKGTHWVPWIHVQDVVSALWFLAKTPTCRGAYNLTAPAPVRYREMTKALGHAMKRPAVVSTPGFLVRLFTGELGTVLLNSQRAVPHRLVDAGYTFHFTDIRTALADLVAQRT